MTYFRARTFLGAIQTLVMMALCGLLIWQLPEMSSLGQLSSELLTALWVGGYLLISLPFDFMGGYLLPQRFSRKHLELTPWLVGWVKAVAVQGIFLWGNAMLLQSMTRWLGWGGALSWVAFAMVILIGFQFYLHLGMNWAGHTVENNQGRLLFLTEHQDNSFTGGIFGLPGKESIVYPADWQEKFPDKVNKLLIARRHGAVNTGTHGRGVILAFLWNIALFGLALFLTPGIPIGGTGFILTASIFTLLSSLSLIGPLPLMSRRGVHEIDRWTYFKGMDADILRESMALTHRLQEDTIDTPLPRAVWQATPTLAVRKETFGQQKGFKGAWQAMRQALFASWAGGNLLNRTLPDQIGRPELWVFHPGD